MSDTNQQYEEVITNCRSVFLSKMKDYGTAWRILRTSSLTDQIYIKANRIRSITEKKTSRVDEGIKPEFVGIINYSVMALIQLELGPAEDTSMAENKALSLYEKHFKTAKKLMEDKNHDYEESAEIIVDHVYRGIDLARKHNLPEQIIDFIRTHHGTRKAEYFYTLAKRDNPDEEVDAGAYTYPGPEPYSKETAVLMMADTVEAASRSLKKPDEEAINNLVESVIDKQISSRQFDNADITFRDIRKIKQLFKKKLLNIYHIRIEYPK